jgi:hypothetical protein
MKYEDACKRLNDCRHLYLDSFGRGTRALDLRVELSEASWLTGSPVSPDNNCLHFTLVFKNYLAVSIINESYDEGDGENSTEWLADKTHKPFASYDKSHFREYVSAVTFATVDFPGPQRHFEINCLDHILNVICQDDPTITISTVDKNTAAESR